MITKHINKLLIVGSVCCFLGTAVTSCSDMMETESERQLFDPEIDQKTDSVFYAMGILQAVQEMVDQYMFVGEMRGDLVATTRYTDNNLRQLADFSATTANKYDSAYVYYKIINNCNYYVAHCDTLLRTGADYVLKNEFVAVKALRAWVYMQLARVYGTVPFYLDPKTQISDIDDNEPERIGMAEIVKRLAPDLEQYAATTGSTRYAVPPSYNNATPGDVGISVAKLFIPVDLVLGDMYLETHQYEAAAKHYIAYLDKVAPGQTIDFGQELSLDNDEQPADWQSTGLKDWARNVYGSTSDAIAYVPFARNRLQGQITQIPKAFGYDYYSRTEGYIEEVQIVPSDTMKNLSKRQDYYYHAKNTGSSATISKFIKKGDARYDTYVRKNDEDTTLVWITKNINARVTLYRRTTVMMRLAEAFNRMEMPDVAFGILKEGLNYGQATVNTVTGKTRAQYVSERSRNKLVALFPELTDATRYGLVANIYGVHMHGSGLVCDLDDNGVYSPGLTSYQPDTIIGVKLAELDYNGSGSKGVLRRLGYSLPATPSLRDSINAMEDLLCDEYALEFSYEGCRFYDLCRLARHKNDAGLYSANFGSQWLADKLAYKQPVVDLTDEKNWYLPLEKK